MEEAVSPENYGKALRAAGQSFLILVRGCRKALIKCHMILERNQLGKNVIH